MPSQLLTQASGAPFPVVSGNFWSGQAALMPRTGIQFYWDDTASGAAYLSLSGSATLTSGGFFLSGGFTDGMKLKPGASIFYPRSVFISGQCNVFAMCDATASGQGRLWWEVL